MSRNEKARNNPCQKDTIRNKLHRHDTARDELHQCDTVRNELCKVTQKGSKRIYSKPS